MRGTDLRTRTFTLDARYLVFPRRRDAGSDAGDAVSVSVDREPFLAVGGAVLAVRDPDFYTYLDVGHARGHVATVTIEGPNADAIDLVRVCDEIPSRHAPYRELERPQVHFSALRGWLNDPSGMIHLDGLWHLYYANNRFANRMAGPDNAWAHAVSPDLIHWREMPLLLCPVRGVRSFWTGGAAIDVANTTGKGRPGAPAVVFAANNGSDAPNAFTQCVFVSTDGGASCAMDARMMYHPLPPQAERRGGGTRDPMILWWEPERKWVMIVYNQPPGGRRSFFFFESRDLVSWRETSVLEDMFECPNLIALPVDGDPRDLRWVIWGSSSEYLVGAFDGSRFLPDGQGKLRTHHGPFTASQVFANPPDGRVVQIGWAHCCNFDREFSQMASFPLELALRSTPRGVRLHAQFVPEIQRLRMEGWRWTDLQLGPGRSIAVGDSTGPMEVLLEMDPGDARSVYLSGAGFEAELDVPCGQARVQETRAALPLKRDQLRLHLLLDTPSVELTVNHGAAYFLGERAPLELRPRTPLQIQVKGGTARIHQIEAYPLISIHERA